MQWPADQAGSQVRRQEIASDDASIMKPRNRVCFNRSDMLVTFDIHCGNVLRRYKIFLSESQLAVR